MPQTYGNAKAYSRQGSREEQSLPLTQLQSFRNDWSLCAKSRKATSSSQMTAT